MSWQYEHRKLREGVCVHMYECIGEVYMCTYMHVMAGKTCLISTKRHKRGIIYCERHTQLWREVLLHKQMLSEGIT